MSEEQFFVEQAEYIDDDAFSKWNALHPNEKNIIRKLTQGGAKLISGPRGCGKTTLLLKAMHTMLKDDGGAFPVYVNFKRSLSIEPLYKNNTDGTYWFNQWIVLKIFQGVYASLEKLKISCKLSISKEHAHLYAEYLEMGNVEKAGAVSITASDIEREIDVATTLAGRSRSVLLLDDAAHAFSPDQQRDFFDFYRQIKSAKISPKAAVYPGVTNYSASFHVGHDAENIDVWIKPDDPGYLSFMNDLVKARFPSKITGSIINDIEVFHLMCFAAFGVPRALMNMIQELVSYDEVGSINKIDYSRRAVIKSIKGHYEKTISLFVQLKNKIPSYKNFIDEGVHVISRSVGFIKQYNKEKPLDKKSVSVALSEADLAGELSRLFGFFQYAGLCIPKDEWVSRGEKGRFKIFIIHYAGLIDANALTSAKAINAAHYVYAFENRNAHEFTRVGGVKIVNNTNVGSVLSLSMPPCSVCSAPRSSKEARFCINCGSPLTTASTYIDLINRDISELALTEKRIKKIREQSSIRKVKDILMDHEHKKLLSVDRIGRYWAEKIVGLAEEFVE